MAEGSWVKIGSMASFKDRGEYEGIRIEHGKHAFALFKTAEGVYALDDVCSHEYAELSSGEVWGDSVYCPKHGSGFNIKTGSVSGLPAVKPVNAYKVKVENGDIYIKKNI